MRPPRPSARARPPARPRPQPLTSRIPLDAVGSNGTVAEQRGLRFSRIKSDVNLQEIAGALPFEDAGGCLPERWRIPQVSPPGARPVLLSWKASHWPRLSRESRFLRESWGGEIRRAWNHILGDQFRPETKPYGTVYKQSVFRHNPELCQQAVQKYGC